MVRVYPLNPRRGHSCPARSAWPKNAFIPVPEYWMEPGLPIAVCALCNTLVAVLGELQPASTTARPLASQNLVAMRTS